MEEGQRENVNPGNSSHRKPNESESKMGRSMRNFVAASDTGLFKPKGNSKVFASSTELYNSAAGNGKTSFGPRSGQSNGPK